MVDDERYTLQELADEAGVSPRTVRYYIAEGLLPPPEPAGHRTHYTRAQLARLRLIGLLKDAYLPLKEIRRQLAGLRDDELSKALEDAERVRPPASEPMAGPVAPAAGEQTRRAQPMLAPGLREANNLYVTQSRLQTDEPDDDALGYINRVLGERRPYPPPRPSHRSDTVWRRLPIGVDGEAELVLSEALYQRRKDRIDALLVWAERMLNQD